MSQIQAGSLRIGGGAPVSVQSMTNTPTHDVGATLAQIHRLAGAGCELVRVAVPDRRAADALGAIAEGSPIPVAADIHFDHRLALEAVRAGVAKIRINPGNIGSEERVAAVARACRDRNIPIRVGVNSGSVHRDLLAKYGGPTPRAMVESALSELERLRRYDMDRLCVSLKASGVRDTIAANRLLRERSDVPIHLGVTHAGTPELGVIKSAVGIGSLLCDGVGDTLRVSLTADPVREVLAGLNLLRAVGLRRDRPEVVACPACGRCKIDVQALAERVEDALASVKRYCAVAVMGCAVNGPGEAAHADVGVAGGDGCGLLFRRGEILHKVPEDQIVPELLRLVEELAREGAV
jgi:(E)-4-hydroxy-3-methylbut-2-enyl-diphosphate synthase